MIDGKGYSYEADYWALGIVLYRVMYGKFPFINTTKDPFDIFKHIIKNNVEFKITSKSTPTLIQLTRLLLSSDPKARMNENGLRNHETFMEVDWEKFESRKWIVPFNIEVFGMKRVDKKIYEEGKNSFGSFISKERKKIE
jgi:serine/threonine protein kinase